jgi:hypothetical protein
MAVKSLEDGIDDVRDSIVDAHESFKVLNGSANGKNLIWAAICRHCNIHKCPFRVRIAYTGKPSVCSLRILAHLICPTECCKG